MKDFNFEVWGISDLIVNQGPNLYILGLLTLDLDFGLDNTGDYHSILLKSQNSSELTYLSVKASPFF